RRMDSPGGREHPRRTPAPAAGPVPLDEAHGSELTWQRGHLDLYLDAGEPQQAEYSLKAVLTEYLACTERPICAKIGIGGALDNGTLTSHEHPTAEHTREAHNVLVSVRSDLRRVASPLASKYTRRLWCVQQVAAKASGRPPGAFIQNPG